MNKRYSITLDEKVHELLIALSKDNNCSQGKIIGILLGHLIQEEKDKENE